MLLENSDKTDNLYEHCFVGDEGDHDPPNDNGQVDWKDLWKLQSPMGVNKATRQEAD